MMAALCRGQTPAWQPLRRTLTFSPTESDLIRPWKFIYRKPSHAKRRRAAALQDAGAPFDDAKSYAGHRIFENALENYPAAFELVIGTPDAENSPQVFKRR